MRNKSGLRDKLFLGYIRPSTAKNMHMILLEGVPAHIDWVTVVKSIEDLIALHATLCHDLHSLIA